MNQPLFDALKLFGDSAKIMIIATTLLLISLSMILTLPSMMVSALLRFYNIEGIATGYIILAAILALSSLLLIFVSIYGMLVNSVYHFASYRSDLSVIKNYIQLSFIGGLILAILGILLYGLGFFISPLATGAGLPLFTIGLFMLWAWRNRFINTLFQAL